MKNKIIYSLFFFVMIFIGIKGVFASELKQKLIDGVYYTRSGGKSGFYEAPFSEYSIDGLTTYCIDPYSRITTDDYIESGGLENSPFTQDINEKLERIGYFGYDYPNHQTLKYRLATQELVWHTIDNSTVVFTTERNGKGEVIDVSKEKLEILRLVEKSYIRPSFNYYNSLKVGQTLELYDNNGVLSDFEVTSNDGANVIIEGNTLKVTPDVTKYSTTIKFTRKSYTNNPTVLFVGKDKVTQTMAYFGLTYKTTSSIYIETIFGTITIEKLDKDNLSVIPKGNASLIGARYAVYTEDNRLLGYVEIKDNSIGISSLNLLIGRYYIIEDRAGEGYTKDPTKYYFEITAENPDPKLTLYNKVIERDVKIYKVFASEKTDFLVGEKNIQFNFYLKSNMELYTTAYTDDDGHLKTTLPYGTYIVRQMNTTPGFEKIEDFEIVVDNNTPNPIIKYISNALIKSKVKIKKIDSESKQIINLDGIKFKIKNLDTGEYICQKITYPTEQNVCVFETNKGIFITPDKLESGHYQLEEVEDQIIPGYTWNKEPLKFDIFEDSNFIYDEENGYIIELNYENKPIKGKIILEKYGENVIYKNNSFTYEETLLDDIIFSLYAYEDIYSGDGRLIYQKDSLIGTYTTINGKIVIDNLYLGIYYLVETSSSNKYIIDNNQYIIELKNNDQYTEIVEESIIVKNYLKKGKLNFIKKDEDSKKALEGVLIEIYDELNDKLIFSGLTNSKGQIILDNLYVGKFYIIEQRSIPGYVKNNRKIYFEIKNNDDIIEVEMLNIKIKGHIKILKIDSETEEPLANAYIAIYNQNNKLVYEGYTNKDGIISVKDLEYGNYYIKELEAPTGYVLKDDIINFSISTNGQTIQILMENDKIKGKMQIIKKDKDTELTIANTLIAIYNNNDDNLIYEGYTDEEGIIYLDNINYGNYYIIEKEPALGYVKNDEKYYFKIQENNEIITIDIFNEKIKGKIYFTKKDKDTNEPVSNTKIAIYNEFDELIYEGYTDEFGNIILDNLIFGKYYIVEKEAAEKYVLNEERIEFEIQYNNQVVEIEMFNEKEKTVEDSFVIPNTFSNDYIISSILILFNIVFGITFISYGKKKKY